MAGIPNNRFVIKERREQVAIFLSQSITETEIAKRLNVAIEDPLKTNKHFGDTVIYGTQHLICLEKPQYCR